MTDFVISAELKDILQAGAGSEHDLDGRKAVEAVLKLCEIEGFELPASIASLLKRAAKLSSGEDIRKVIRAVLELADESVMVDPSAEKPKAKEETTQLEEDEAFFLKRLREATRFSTAGSGAAQKWARGVADVLKGDPRFVCIENGGAVKSISLKNTSEKITIARGCIPAGRKSIVRMMEKLGYEDFSL